MDQNQNLLTQISALKISDLDISELEDVTISLTKNFVISIKCIENGSTGDPNFNENTLNYIRYLKIICSKGPSLQNLIAHTNGMMDGIKLIIQSDCDQNIQLRAFQLLANLSVQNEKIQKKLWNESGDLLMEKFNSDDCDYINVSAMIIYNIVLSTAEIIDRNMILRESLKHYDRFLKEHSTNIPDFLHMLLEYFICEYNEIIAAYEVLEAEHKKILLFYIHDHIENDSNLIINQQFLHYLTSEFKKSSDCVLKTVTSYVDQIDPHFVVILLDIISTATTHEKYLTALKDDRALFLNTGCLLQALHKVGKKSDNTFTPIQRLDAMVPSSSENSDFEKEISFSFKTKLVKTLANLSYRNKRNQDLAREMEIMHSIFECTNLDARNPLIKEWSILAIRNLCEDNMENQEVVGSLTKVGNADNPVLSEFKVDEGIFRITK